jgi:predicted ribonuclease YlaK
VERHPEGVMLRRRLLRDECRMWGLDAAQPRADLRRRRCFKNPATKLVSLVGKAGTGKTLLAMAAGLEQVLDPKRKLYRKIVVMRPLVSVGKEMGWLPGDVNEKIHPWMKPIFDNVQFLLGDEKKGNGTARTATTPTGSSSSWNRASSSSRRFRSCAAVPSTTRSS